MAEFNKIRLSIFVSLTIFSAHALDVIFSSADGAIKQQFRIKTDIRNTQKTYHGTSNQFIYQAQNGTSKVIVHISSKSRLVEIVRHAVRETRLQIDQELREKYCELVFLGIENFDDDEYNLITAFILEKIQCHPNQRKNFKIETIGENRFDRSYQWHVVNFSRYQENDQICGGTLLSRLRSIPRGALRPLGSNNKEIRLFEYRPFVREVTWPVRMEGNEYVPVVNVSDPVYNFKKYHRNKIIHLVVLSGREYLIAISHGTRSKKMLQIREFQKEMKKNKEVLIIFGVFNFDWTEVDIVTQIILCHSQSQQDSFNYVYTSGFGMFNTIYRGGNDGVLLLPEQNPTIAEIMKVLIEEEVKGRSIHMHYKGWTVSPMPINLANGRYFAERGLKNFYFPWLNQKIAFIVYDQTELNGPIDFSIVGQSVDKMARSGIHVVIVEAINFELDDMHIIAEWLDRHKGNISSEQIAVLGCGIFDTIFQSDITTYDTFHSKKNELQIIRNAYAKSLNKKCIFAADIDDPSLESRLYLMITVNGFYEPYLMPDWNIFDSRNGRKLYFIITSGYVFHKILAVGDIGSITLAFREKLKEYDPDSEWSLFLVGLANFEERDFHLFAEFVGAHTNDERSLGEFVHTFNYGISEDIYQFKDTMVFAIEGCQRIRKFLTYSLGLALKLSPDT